MNKNLFSFKNWQLIFIFTLFYACISWLTNHWVLTDGFYYSALENQLSSEKIDSFIALNKKIQWIGYVVIPFFLLLKWLVIASIIYTGLFLFNNTISFNTCFKIGMIAEFSMLLSAIVKVFLFLIQRPESIQEVQFFYPFSILHFFSQTQIPVYLIYPLQQLNLFEIGYCLFLSYGIKVNAKISFSSSLRVLASSYGIGMIIWILLITFIQLQLN